MNSLFLRKLQLVCLLSNRMEHLERPKKLRLQFLVMFALDIVAVQPHFLTGGVTPRFISLIVSSFFEALGHGTDFLGKQSSTL